jgi:hypothetical protein
MPTHPHLYGQFSSASVLSEEHDSGCICIAAAHAACGAEAALIYGDGIRGRIREDKLAFGASPCAAAGAKESQGLEFRCGEPAEVRFWGC